MRASSKRILALSASLLILFPASVRPQADSNQTVTAIDSRITYDGNWTVQENGGHTFISVAGSFALNFTGSAVYWFSRKLYNGAVAAITLDEDDAVFIDLSAGVGQNDTPVVAVLYAKEGLEVNQSHRLNVTWNGPGSNGVGSFLENYRVQFVDNASAPTAAQPTASSPSPAKPPAKLNIGAIAGGTVGGVFGVLIVVAGLLCLRKRKGRTAAQQDMQSATPFTSPRNPVAPIAPSSTYSMKATLDDQQRLQNQRENNNSYTSTNPTSSASLLSPGMTAPPVSLPTRTPDSSRFGFASSWGRLRSDLSSGVPGGTGRSPLGVATSTDTFLIGRDIGSSSGLATTSMTPPPLSPGSMDRQEELEDPPPVYRG